MNSSHPVTSISRATHWQLRNKTLSFSQIPLLMGIVNVTPDSFSDGGKYDDAPRAIEHALRLVEHGAAILDIGGESTRPYSTPVSADEELRRVMPVIQTLAEKTNVVISIDTSKFEVAREALAAGAEIINDVTGLEGDPRMLGLAAQSQAGVCAMHMRGTPQTMQDEPTYNDVVNEIFLYLQQRRDALLHAGIESSHICLDPGIGFGKTHQHNITLLANCWRYHALGCPLLIGPSRKGFIGKVLGDKEANRVAGTVGVALALACQGMQLLRVHDVQQVQQALKLFAAVGGIDGREATV